MFDNINGARLAAKRLHKAIGMPAARAKEIVARAAGWRDWHHLEKTIDNAAAPRARSVGTLEAYLAEHLPEVALNEVVAIITPGTDGVVPDRNIGAWADIKEGDGSLRKAVCLKRSDDISPTAPLHYEFSLPSGDWVLGDLEDTHPEVFDGFSEGMGRFSQLPLGLFRNGRLEVLWIAVGDRIAMLGRLNDAHSDEDRRKAIAMPQGAVVRSSISAFDTLKAKAGVFNGDDMVMDLHLPSRSVKPRYGVETHHKDGRPAIVRTQVLRDLMKHAAKRLGAGVEVESATWHLGMLPQPDWHIEIEAYGWSPSLHETRIRLKANLTRKLVGQLGDGGDKQATEEQIKAARDAFDEAFADKIAIQEARAARAAALGISGPLREFDDLRGVVVDEWLEGQVSYRRKRGRQGLARALQEIHRYGHERQEGTMGVGTHASDVFRGASVPNARLVERAGVTTLDVEVALADGSTVFGNVLATEATVADDVEGRPLGEVVGCHAGLAGRKVLAVGRAGGLTKVTFEPAPVKAR